MISIVVPVYNAAKFIEETIETVLNQTYTDWELLLVDDCSKDSSVQLIESRIQKLKEKDETKADRIRLIRMPQNGGAAKARNAGIDAAKGRYIAFLDADDIWRTDKLEKEILYMEKHEAAFVYTAYDYGDEEAIPTGKTVHVEKRLTYKQALSRTIIFTSTVLLDREKIPDNLIHMPVIGSEDTATWWRILKTGIVAFGLDQPLVIYRRPQNSLSSNKKVAVERIWNLYLQIAELSKPTAAFYLVRWAYHASIRRVVDDTIHKHVESVKRFVVVQLSLIGLLLHTALYAIVWFKKYYPIIISIRVSQDGYVLGYGIKLYFRGHLLILTIYFLLLLFVSRSGGGMKTGYLKPGEAFSGVVTALAITNLVSYFQISLMRNWLVPVTPMLALMTGQIILEAAWANIADVIYRHVFPPRETLVISGEESIQPIIDRFDDRSERFRIMKTMNISEGKDRICQECLRWYGCVVVGGVNDQTARQIAEFCYRHYIRVYLVPSVSDVLLHGAEQIELFDAPLLELREYSIRWEERVIKRTADLILALIGLVITSPILLFKLLKNLLTEQKSGIVSIQSAGKDGNIFKAFFFERRTIGYRIPLLFNVIRGNMSMVGPERMSEKQYHDLIDKNEQFFYRTRVKPGLTGYASLHSGDTTPQEEILKMDLYYVQHFSLLLDIKILLQSLRARH